MPNVNVQTNTWGMNEHIMALALKAQSIALDKFSCNIYNFYNDV